MEKPRVYIETTIPSYLTSRPSREVVTAGHQQTTRDWWDTRRQDFELLVSALVLEEAGRGDSDAVARRQNVLAGIPILQMKSNVADFAAVLIKEATIPVAASDDALHVALAVVHGMDYLLTWNLKHIAKAETRRKIEHVSHSFGFEPPIICTPEELLES